MKPVNKVYLFLFHFTNAFLWKPKKFTSRIVNDFEAMLEQ